MIWMSVQQDGTCASMNVSIHKAATNVRVQKDTIRLETNVQVNHFFHLTLLDLFKLLVTKLIVSVSFEKERFRQTMMRRLTVI